MQLNMFKVGLFENIDKGDNILIRLSKKTREIIDYQY